MTALALRVFWISLTTSAVLLPLLLLEGKIRTRYRAKSCYILWLALALRLLIPVEIPLPEAPVTVEVPVSEAYFSLLSRGDGWEEPVPTTAELPHVPETSTLSAQELAVLVWAAGAGLVLVVQGISYSTIRRKLWRNSCREGEDQALLEQLGGTVPVLRTDVDTPMTLGLLCPVILLPREVEGRDLPLILRHELCHLRRKDLWYKAVFLLVSAIHWFNPLVWRLGRVAGENLELCCDETVVAGEDDLFRRRYGQVLLHSAAGRSNPALATRFGSSDLKGRLMNLFITKKRGAVLVCTAVCSALLMGSLVGCEIKAASLNEETVKPSASTQVTNQTIFADQSSQEAEPSPSVETGELEEWLWPLEGEYTLSALFGSRTHPITGTTTDHPGVDVVAEKGTPVLAAAAGTVEKAEFDKELGNHIVLLHDNDRVTVYGCLEEMKVQAGDTVKQGDTIGTVGATGMATGPHFHFEVSDVEGNRYDPLLIATVPKQEFQVQNGDKTAALEP